MNAQHLPPEALDDWCAAASTELGIEDADVPIDLVLRVAADVAHGVARPAAPLSTYLLGLALGKGETSTQRLEALASQLMGLADGWQTRSSTGSEE